MKKIAAVIIIICLILAQSASFGAITTDDLSVFGTFDNFRIHSDTDEVVSFNNFYKLFNDRSYRQDFALNPVLEVILEPNRAYSFEFGNGTTNFDNYNLSYEITGAQSNNFRFYERVGNRFYFYTTGDFTLDANSVAGVKLKIFANSKDNTMRAVFDGDAFADQYIRETLAIDRKNTAEFVIKIGYRRFDDDQSGPLIIKQHFANLKTANSGADDTNLQGIIYSLSNVDVIFDRIDTPKTVNMMQGALPEATRDLIADKSTIVVPFKFNQSLPGKATLCGYIPQDFRDENVTRIYVYNVNQDGHLSLFRDDVVVDNSYFEFKIGSTPAFIISKDILPTNEFSSAGGQSDSSEGGSSTSISGTSLNPSTGG